MFYNLSTQMPALINFDEAIRRDMEETLAYLTDDILKEIVAEDYARELWGSHVDNIATLVDDIEEAEARFMDVAIRTITEAKSAASL